MILTIDIGNTNTVLGLFEKKKLVNSWRIKSDTRDTADELWISIRTLLSTHGELNTNFNLQDAIKVEITGIALCSTVPSLLREMRTTISRYFSGIPSVIVEPGTKTGVPLLVDNPKEIGADRIVNSLAAHELFGKASGKENCAIVVDFGTSTNLDVVSPKGEFLGGALAAGIEISVEAIASRAAQLRRVELVKPKNVIGKNTVEALQSGTIYGFAGQVDGLVKRICAELMQAYPNSGKPAVIATGGLAPLVFGVCEEVEFHEPDLTLMGLEMIFERNS
jgi:type III pantothenate kinase